MTNVLQAFVAVLYEAYRQKQRAENQVIGDIVREQRHEMHPWDPGAKLDSLRPNKVTSTTPSDGAKWTHTPGWRDSPQLSGWQKSVGIEKIDRMADHFAAIDKAEQAEQLAKAKRGGK